MTEIGLFASSLNVTLIFFVIVRSFARLFVIDISILLDDRTNGRAIATLLHLSVVCRL